MFARQQPSSRPQTPQTPQAQLEAAQTSNGVRDNIKVSVRIRPLSDKESSRGDRAVWGSDGSGGVGLLSAAGDKLDLKFAYDVVFSPSHSNAEVFDQVAWPVIEPVLQGISGTVFAYGVTSSGKTHTMMGTPSDAGVVPRAIAALFDRISEAEDCVYTVKLSMMEIYCETLNDLLDSSKMNLDVQESQGSNGKGPVLVVKGLTEGKVGSAEEALVLIQQGQDNRKVASTALNDQSSRSHTICRLQVESSPKHSSTGSTSALHTGSAAPSPDAFNRPGSASGMLRSSGSFATGALAGAGSKGSYSGPSVSSTSAWLTLVDLAGSEGARAALSKDQQAEARDINRSLLTLGKVMYELAKGGSAGHLPFRDSLLTRLLKPSLTGNGARVAIICNVTPAASQSEETWNTLRFADGAKRIKVTAVKNEALDIAAVVAQYQKEVAMLKAQLAALSGAAGGHLSADVLQAIQATLDGTNKANEADQLQDQAAQLQYLRECLSFAMQERDQLLLMNHKLTTMLVKHVKLVAASKTAEGAGQAAAAGGAGTDAGAGAETTAAAGAAGSSSASEAPSSSSSNCAIKGGAAVCGGHACKRSVKLRRCLSYESLEYYGQWSGGKAGSSSMQQQQQSQPQSPAGMDEPGLECNAADAAEVQNLLRITSDELPDSIPEEQKRQVLQQQDQVLHASVQPPQQQANTTGACGSGAHAEQSCSSSSETAADKAAATAAGAVHVVPCQIVFPGSRRTSKTLALAVPGAAPAGARPAGWLGCVQLPELPAGVARSALSEVVQAHITAAEQETRLELLMQQLADKEALLEQARQLQQGQVLQLRLTITAADRALLRDKLAEAEQQLTSYRAQESQMQQNLQALLDHVTQLRAALEQAVRERDEVASQLQLAASPSCSGSGFVAAADAAVFSVTGGAAGAAGADACGLEGLATQRSLSRKSSASNSPEPGSRIPLPPGSPTRGLYGTIGSPGGSPIPANRAASGSSIFSKTWGGPPTRSAASAATFNSIRSAMMSATAAQGTSPQQEKAPQAAGAADSGVNSRSPRRFSNSSLAAGGAAAAPASAMSPRLAKLGAGLQGLCVDGNAGSPVVMLSGAPPGTSSSAVSSSIRASQSPGASPLSMSRSNSTLPKPLAAAAGPADSSSSGGAAAGQLTSTRQSRIPQLLPILNKGLVQPGGAAASSNSSGANDCGHCGSCGNSSSSIKAVRMDVKESLHAMQDPSSADTLDKEVSVASHPLPDHAIRQSVAGSVGSTRSSEVCLHCSQCSAVQEHVGDSLGC